MQFASKIIEILRNRVYIHNTLLTFKYEVKISTYALPVEVKIAHTFWSNTLDKGVLASLLHTSRSTEYSIVLFLLLVALPKIISELGVPFFSSKILDIPTNTKPNWNGIKKIIAMVSNWQIWCNLENSVWSWTCDIFSFLVHCSAHLERYILLKTPHESDHWFQSYEQLKDSQNNRKQRKLIPFSGYIPQSILPTTYWFC